LRNFACINGIHYPVTVIVNTKRLAIKSRFIGTPDFGFILNLEDIMLSKCKSFIGTEILVTSCDEYIVHKFKDMPISHRLAKQIDKLSDNKFGYQNLQQKHDGGHFTRLKSASKMPTCKAL
jgi:antirestriction protein